MTEDKKETVMAQDGLSASLKNALKDADPSKQPPVPQQDSKKKQA